MAGRIANWLDERTGFRQFRVKKMGQAVPSHMGFLYCFGGISLFILLLQVVTGLFMVFYYEPTPQAALRSIEQMSNQVPLGWLFRNMHRWGATLLLAALFSHMISVGFQRAYSRPRELNWLSGVLQFVVVFLLLATGLLLPWDWRAYWSFAIWMDYVGTWPLIGTAVQGFFLDNFTINRGFVIHVLVLPLVLLILLRFHFGMVRRHGISEPL